MAAALLVLVVTAAAAVAFAAWRQGSGLRRWHALRAWAHEAGWTLTATADDVPWPLTPPVRGVPQAVVSGRHRGYDVVVVWTATGGGAATTAYVRLSGARPARLVPRGRPADPVVAVEDACLAVSYGRWLDPTEVDDAVDAAVAAAGTA